MVFDISNICSWQCENIEISSLNCAQNTTFFHSRGYLQCTSGLGYFSTYFMTEEIVMQINSTLLYKLEIILF